MKIQIRKREMPDCPYCKKNDRVFASHMFGKKDVTCTRCKRTFQPTIRSEKKETEMKKNTTAKTTTTAKKTATKKATRTTKKSISKKPTLRMRLQARIKKIEVRMAKGKVILAKREARLKTLQQRLRKLAA